MRERGKGARQLTKLAERDVEKRPHDLRIEVRAGRTHEFGTGLGERHGLLVRPGRGHYLEAVADGDKPSRIRDLVAAQALGIPRAIELFVVLPDAVGPRPEPGNEWRGSYFARAGVPEDDHPFGVVESAGLVQDARGNVELADVVKQRGPLQLRALVSVEAHFVGQKRGVGPRPFRVPNGPAVVPAQRGDHGQEIFGARLSVARVGGVLHLAEPLLEIGPEREAQARRRVIGKDQGH